MPEMQHALAAEFPQYAARITELKASDRIFARLYEDYHEVNREVLAAETYEAPTDRFHEEDMKKVRAMLKDKLFRMLAG